MNETERTSSSTKLSASSKAVSLTANSVNKKISISSKNTASTYVVHTRPTKVSRVRIVQNFKLIWLGANIDSSGADFQHSLTELRRIVNTIDTFADSDQCVDFLQKIKDEKAIVFVSDTSSQQLIPLIHELSQLDSIYIFCKTKLEHQEWKKKWTKVRGVFTQIESICTTLEQDIQQCDRNSISISLTSGDLNHLDPSFMYTQLLKEILVEIQHVDKAKTEFTDFCRKQYLNNPSTLQIINEFERDYDEHTSIWWYTRDCFIYQMLNRALRTQEVEVIIKMGFFLCDLHHQIEHLHSQTEYHSLFTVYRGQGMRNADFEKIRQNKGGLLAFNNFLSTSVDQQVSLLYAESSREDPELTGVFFQINIDPTLSSTPFASIENVSFFESEQEILFSMHTVFRIDQITSIEDRLWRVELVLTTDSDKELKKLTNHIRQETLGRTGWHQLGNMLIRMGNFDKAEEVYQILLEEISDDDQEAFAHCHYQLGRIKHQKGDYNGALDFYQKTTEIQEKSPLQNHLELAKTYNDIGLVHMNMGEYLKAMDFYQKTLEIQEKFLLLNDPKLATTYNNIAVLHYYMGDYSKALAFYHKTFEIDQESLPWNHPSFATTYNNIGSTYKNLGKYLKALEFHEKALDIQEKSLPSNHPDLTTTYSHIGLVYNKMKEYSKALELFRKSLEIRQNFLPSNHPDLAIIYNNIGLVHNNIGEYPEALEFHQKALEIKLVSLPSNHPDLAISYDNIGSVHKKLGEYQKALEFYQKALEIRQKSLPSNHPNLATTYNNIGSVYNNMGNYSKAISFYKRAVEIGYNFLPHDHPDLQLYIEDLAEIRNKLIEKQTGLPLEEETYQSAHSNSCF